MTLVSCVCECGVVLGGCSVGVGVGEKKEMKREKSHRCSGKRNVSRLGHVENYRDSVATVEL